MALLLVLMDGRLSTSAPTDLNRGTMRTAAAVATSRRSGRKSKMTRTRGTTPLSIRAGRCRLLVSSSSRLRAFASSRLLVFSLLPPLVRRRVVDPPRGPRRPCPPDRGLLLCCCVVFSFFFFFFFFLPLSLKTLSHCSCLHPYSINTTRLLLFASSAQPKETSPLRIIVGCSLPVWPYQATINSSHTKSALQVTVASHLAVSISI